MTTEYDELQRLVSTDPVHTHGQPDLEAVRREGRRLRTRRRLVSGLAAAAVVGVLAVPAYLMVGTTDAAPGGDFATAPPKASATGKPAPKPAPVTISDLEEGEDVRPQSCGVIACSFLRPAEHMVEGGEVLGAWLPMGEFEGMQEVLYAARVDGVDLRDGHEEEVTVLMAGVQDGETLRRTVWALQPGTEPGNPPIRLYGGGLHASGEEDRWHYGVIGYVEGVHDVVEVTSATFGTRPVTGVSHDVLPGWTVFFDTGPWDEAWGTDSTGRAPLTYGVPGGPDCSLLACGSVG